MRKKSVLFLSGLFISYLSVFGQTERAPLLEEIDYFKMHSSSSRAITIVQNVETDWGKLGVKGYVKTIKEWILREGREHSVELYHFNIHGKLTRYEGQDIDDVTNTLIPVVVDYMYDDQNRLVRIVENKKGKINHKDIQYSRNTLVSATYHKNGMIARYGRDNYVFKYYENGQIAEVENHRIKQETPHRFEYDSRGHCITETYDNAGVAKSVDRKNDEFWLETHYILDFTYNEKGNLLTQDGERSHVKNRPDVRLITVTNSFIYSYTHDHAGNWITKKIFGGFPLIDEKIERQYEYYTDKELNVRPPEDEPEDTVSVPPVNKRNGSVPRVNRPSDPVPPVKPPGQIRRNIRKILLECDNEEIGISTNTPISWNGTIGRSFQAGEGTEESPYIIALPSQLAYLARCVNEGNTFEGKYFVLVNDIDLGGQRQVKYEWKPIGSAKGTYFGGQFYGNKRTVYNMQITVNGEDGCAGLFGTIGKTGMVSEIIIDKTSHLKGSVAGGIAAYNEGHIEACRSAVRCEGADIGGIAGINKGSIENCISEAILYLPTYTAGGISAKNGGAISRCAYKGNIHFMITSKYCGGITGEMLAGGTISDCYHTGNISANSFSVRTGVGGLIGSKNLKDLHGVSIKDCYSAGTGEGYHIIPDYKKNISYFSNCFFDTGIKTLGKPEMKEHAWYGQNGARGTPEMKSEELVDLLNGNNRIWFRDNNRTNKGYPILAIEKEDTQSRFVDCKQRIPETNPQTGRKHRVPGPGPYPRPKGTSVPAPRQEHTPGAGTREASGVPAPEEKNADEQPVDTVNTPTFTRAARFTGCSKANPCKVNYVVLNDLKYWDVESVVFTHLKGGSPSFDITIVGKEDSREFKGSRLFVNTTAVNANSYELMSHKTGTALFPPLNKGERKTITLVFLSPHDYDPQKFAGLAFYLHEPYGDIGILAPYDKRWKYIRSN